MSITDELREFIEDKAWMANNYAKALAIADRIDAEHEAMLEDARKRVYEGYIGLPKDADGELIRTGDMMQIRDCDGRWCGPFKVLYRVLFTGVEWGIVFDAGTYAPKECRHYHEPTVEDVLREFYSRYCITKPKKEDDAILAEYAAKLRLAREDA